MTASRIGLERTAGVGSTRKVTRVERRPQLGRDLDRAANGDDEIIVGDRPLWLDRIGVKAEQRHQVSAEELELLEAGERSWRSDAADRLRALLEQPAELGQRDGDLLTLVALELSGEEDKAALEQGLVTWRTLAADECSELAAAVRR